MIRADVREDKEATINRFLQGLQREIKNQVELFPFVEIEEAVQLAAKVEKQLKHQGSGRRFPTASNSPKPSFEPNLKPEPPRAMVRNTTPAVPEKSSTSSGTIRCFKCHGYCHKAHQCANHKVMILRDGKYCSEDEEEEKQNHTEDSELGEEMEAADGSLLALQRALASQEEDLPIVDQRSNLFHTRCQVQGKILTVIEDGGSCANVVSLDAAKKLGLTMIPRPEPYSLHWLSDHAVINGCPF
ncbi:unnamed protein product [Linum trigynum]|uniref:Uncharacterized protein n=1 Tax=Linum trigynum TaxID=586398 RepID=A0AAV2FYD7_9ROSI